MRRAVLFDAYPQVYAGAQRCDHLLARVLPARGWELTTMTPAAGPFTDRLRADGLPVEVVAVPAPLRHYGRATTGRRAVLAALALPAYWMRLTRVLRRRRPEVVHVIDHRGMVLAGVPARLSRARVIWHIHALHRGRALNAVGGRVAHCTVVPAAAAIAKLPGLRPGTRVRAITNAVPDDARRSTPVDLVPTLRIVTMARLHPDKGLDLLVDALALVRLEVPDATVLVVGGPQEGFEALGDELRARARRQGVGDAFELLGFTDHPAEVLAGARCYVQPARERTEILPLAVLEAMAIGVPVVATDVGAIREVVRDDETGLLVPPEDAAGLAAALVRVLVEPGTAVRLRDAAFALVGQRRFHPDGFVDAVVSAYEGAPHG